VRGTSLGLTNYGGCEKVVSSDQPKMRQNYVFRNQLSFEMGRFVWV
jgi:hypothetical protein